MAACKYPRLVEFRDSLPTPPPARSSKRELARHPEPVGARDH
jgi:hypothetical protein